MIPLYCSQGHKNALSSRFCKDCGQQLPLAVGTVLEKRYRIVSHLGQGGFGRTYLAEALHRFNERCVLKEFAPQVQSLPELEKAKELFEREAGALHKLHHPQLPGFLELFQADMGGGVGCLFLVQDYVEGQTCFDLFKSGKQLSEAEVTQLLCQMLSVLSYIHSKGVIHRDISPDNIIIRKSDHLPVLIDFGGVKQIAATAVSKFTNTGLIETRLGKKEYAPEEQIRKGQVFVSSDLYSLAITALVLLTGKEPPDLYDSYKGVWRWRKVIKVSRQLEAVLKKMLAHKPGDRFSSADDVLQALSKIARTNTYLSQRQTNTVSPNVNPTPLSLTSNGNSQVHTLVVAPGKPAPIAIAPAYPAPNPIAVNSNNPVIQKPPQILNWFGSLAIKLAVGAGLVLVTGFTGWAVMSSVIRSTQVSSVGVRSSSNKPTDAPSSAEKNQVEKLMSRRQSLGIDEATFNEQVNKRFYGKHPELNGRPLTTKPEDAALRKEWYKIAEEFLAKTPRR
jgi:serine/threonine-protein kinase